MVKMRSEFDDGDQLESVDYTYHDARSFAEQEVVDKENNYKIITSWFKPLGGEAEGEEAGANWAVRVRGEVLDECEYLAEVVNEVFVR